MLKADLNKKQHDHAHRLLIQDQIQLKLMLKYSIKNFLNIKYFKKIYIYIIHLKYFEVNLVVFVAEATVVAELQRLSYFK